MSTLGEHQGNGIRFDMHLSAPNGGIAQMLCRPEGQWVSWNEYEKLKAEVAYLKGEEHPYSDLGSMMPKYLLEHWINENARLKADVERLRKAGDNLITALNKRDDCFDNSDKRQAIADWNAAKEGKQS